MRSFLATDDVLRMRGIASFPQGCPASRIARVGKRV